MRSIVGVAALAITLAARAVLARDVGDPIRMAWIEGDVAGLSVIHSPDGEKTIGSIDYHQWHHGHVLHIVRIARFGDGPSDEDRVEARVGETLQTLRGRSIIRNTAGVATVDIRIDVAAGHITGFSGVGKDRQEYDEHADLTPATYWGPLIFMVIKNFDLNATDGRLVFHSVVATPKPRVLDMEILPEGKTVVRHIGERIDGMNFLLRPTINPLVDPIVHAFAPETTFIIAPGTPPFMARFQGPRNYAGQKIRIE